MKRYINIWLIANAVLTLNAQQYEDQSRSLNFGENYVKTTTMLDASANQSVTTIQFFDGLGRPSELVEGGISTGGRYLHSIQMFDNLGREYIRTLPAVGSTYNSPMEIPGVSYACQQTYNDTHYYSRTTYDALDRPVFTTTPGQNWEGKGKTIEYVTNGNNEVKRYRVNNSVPALNGRYPAGSLTGERVIDEDGIAITTYKDLTGRIVMERRGDNDDTYFVYDAKGLLCFILQPMYQDSPVAGYMFRYANDAQGRCTSKTLPGCSAIKYWYDGANRIIAKREPLRGASVCTRRYYYDGLGRLVVQGRTVHIPQNANTPIITSRTPAAGTAEIGHTGYYVDAARIPQDLQLEIVNYYDDYAFLSSGIFTDSIPSGNFQASSPVCASTLKTGDITATSDGHLLARVYYYDERGRVADTRENLLGGEFLRTTTSYSFTDKPLTVQKDLSSEADISPIIESYTYDTQTDQLKYHDISYNSIQHRISAYTYNDLGRLTKEMAANEIYEIERDYNIHGWLTSINAKKSNNHQTAFLQDLYYETGSGQPCYNGNISSMRWKMGYDDYGHGYKFVYDQRNRLTQANNTFFDMIDYPICNSERVTYNRNSSPIGLKRYGCSTGQVLDSLLYTYNGNRLKKIIDVSSHTISNGMFEFVNGTDVQTEYLYYGLGDLKHDVNKGIASIKYDYLGHPIRIQFTNGNLIEYVYAADGRKLRTKHSTAVEGLTVPLDGTLELTAAQVMARDSIEHAGNIRYNWQHFYTFYNALHLDYSFDGGYLSIFPSTGGEPSGSGPIVVQYGHNCHYYIRDHQGNNRLVVDGNGNEEQKNEYYPYGGPWGDASTNQGFQPYKYNSKELDRMHGLDWYDYGARRYDPAFCMFTQIDPLAEKYPHLNPYVYCAGNPVNYVDPDGRSTWVVNLGCGRYEVVGGILDKDKRIYLSDYVDGQYVPTKEYIGYTSSTTSFYNSDKKAWATGSIIDINDQSGNSFLEKIIGGNPPMFDDYMLNARKGHPYDFKVTNGTDKPIDGIDIYRGMPIGTKKDGYIVFSSARDVGNIAAGYIAAVNGMSWKASRIAFDSYQGGFEKASTKNAEYVGWRMGYHNSTSTQNAKNLRKSLHSVLFSIWNFLF